jgi:hypothetical protein
MKPLPIAAAALIACVTGCARHAPAGTSTPGNCNLAGTPFCNAHETVPPGWTGHRFKLLQDYRDARNAPDAMPWKKYDYATQPRQYVFALLTYAYRGNYGTTWDTPNNRWKARHWFHAPALDYGDNGREPISGLTRERTSAIHELGDGQIHCWDNWAVGLYNDPGGFTLGKVWSNHMAPDPAAARFPEGTMSVKLLFTSAPVSEVPWLNGSPEWDADIYEGDTTAGNHCAAPPTNPPRVPQKVRLLQVDVAVKDSRANPITGWVFGTFVYQGGRPQPELVAIGAKNGWQNLAPVGLMWGNDPGLAAGQKPKQTWPNPDVSMSHLGYQGRLNGPVDNKISSCLSCHGTAEVALDAMIPPTAAPGQPPPDVSPWFQNIPSGVPFEKGHISTDYSLQVAFGIRNFNQNHPSAAAENGVSAQNALSPKLTGNFSPRDPPYVAPSQPINWSGFRKPHPAPTPR